MRYVYTIIRSYAFDDKDITDFEEAETKGDIKKILDNEFTLDDLDFWFRKHEEITILEKDCD